MKLAAPLALALLLALPSLASPQGTGGTKTKPAAANTVNGQTQGAGRRGAPIKPFPGARSASE